MAEVVVRSTQPALGAIKLAWWRERLEDLDQGKLPVEPRLRAAAAELLPQRISGADLAQLEEGWTSLLNEQADQAQLTENGTRLFQFGARLLGVEFDDITIGAAGRMFAEVDARRRGLIDTVRGSDGRGLGSVPSRARALTGLAALAARDLRKGGPPFEPEGTPGRAWTLLLHRLTGRLPP